VEEKLGLKVYRMEWKQELLSLRVGLQRNAKLLRTVQNLLIYSNPPKLQNPRSENTEW
jgi:hypothetical protein